MAYCIERTRYNGYRCGCCRRDNSDSWWVESLEKALAELPTSFPCENDGGVISVYVRDGATGHLIAESVVSWPPAYQRGDGYRFTRWHRRIDEEAAPGRGTAVTEIIEGTNHAEKLQPQPHPIEEGNLPPEGFKLVTDRSWSDILDSLAEKKRQADLRKAEGELAEAQRKITALRGAG